MSTIEQKDKGTEVKGRSTAKKPVAARPEAAKEAKAQPREANPARASLLDLYFGEAAPKPKGSGRPSESRPTPERSGSAERRPTAEVSRPAAEAVRPGAEVRRRPAASAPAAERRAAAEVSTTERTQPAPESVQPEEVVAEEASPAPERPVAAAEPVAPVVEEPVAEAAPVVAAAEPESSSAAEPEAVATSAEQSEGEGNLDEGPRPRLAGGLAEGPRPRPAGLAEGPRPRQPGMLEGPRPRGTGPVAEGPRPRPAGLLDGPRPRPAGGMPDLPRRGMEGGPRPPGMGSMPMRPGPGGPERSGPGRPGAGGGFNRGPRPGRGGGLTIPKVDPKVAEQQQQQAANQRRPLGQGGDRRKGDAFSKRENDASRPPEERLFGRRPSRQATLVERRSLKPITIDGAMTVKELAHEMGVTAAEVIKKLLTGFGIMATINQELDTDTCVLIGAEFGIEVSVKEPEITETFETVDDPDEADELKKPRWPVVTIMGHVDHGKTSLLDAIRHAKVAHGEAGGITQHIGAYTVEIHGKKITFLDTPGHEAFTAMRARGANVTDIAILVVAADDSVMPQTIESINHAKAAGVQILVAINKIDKEQANPDRVKQDLTAHGLITEEWGGETIMVPVSAKTQKNLDLLLENVLIVSEMLELKANPDKDARGTILEAELDKGRGPVATVLVQAGTLHPGDAFVAGTAWGTVRAMFDERGRKLKKAGPSQPVQILGFNSVPSAGDIFRVAPDARLARDVAERRLTQVRAEQQQSARVSLEDLMARVKQGEMKDLNIIIKADVQGSVEAIRGQLEKIKNDEVNVKMIHSGVGAISETDVMLAMTAKAVVVGFNVRPDDRAANAAREQNVDVRTYNVIYDIVDDINTAIEGMLKPRIEEVTLGKAEVRQIFKVPKAGMAAGCMVIDGKITRNARVRLVRDGIVVHDGEMNSLRRFKDEVRDVATGYECGISLERYQDFKLGDILEAYELKEVKAGAAS